MIEKDTLGYTIRAKTGWGGQSMKEIGWYVGYLETKSNVFYFSNCIQTDSKNVEDVQRAILFDHARKDIVFDILAALNLLQ